MSKINLLAGMNIPSMTSSDIEVVVDKKAELKKALGISKLSNNRKDVKAFLAICGVEKLSDLDNIDDSEFKFALESYAIKFNMDKPIVYLQNALRPILEHTFNEFINGNLSFYKYDKNGNKIGIVDEKYQNDFRDTLAESFDLDDYVKYFVYFISKLKLGQDVNSKVVESVNEIALRGEFVGHFLLNEVGPHSKDFSDVDYIHNLRYIANQLMESFYLVDYKSENGKVASFVFKQTINRYGNPTNVVSINKLFLIDVINASRFKGKFVEFFNRKDYKGGVTNPFNLLKTDKDGKIVRVYKDNTAIYKADVQKYVPENEVPDVLVETLHMLNNMEFKLSKFIMDGGKKVLEMYSKFYEFKSKKNHPVLNKNKKMVFIDKDGKEVYLYIDGAESAYMSMMTDFSRIVDIMDRVGYFHFQWKVGVDNGRFYPVNSGAGVATQTGEIGNTIFGAEPRVLTDKSKVILQNHVVDLKNKHKKAKNKLASFNRKNPSTKMTDELLDIKWKLEEEAHEAKLILAYYEWNLARGLANFKVDVIIEADQQASGTCQQTASLGAKSQMSLCGLNTKWEDQVKIGDIYKAMEKDGIGLFVVTEDGNRFEILEENIKELIEEVGVRELGKLLYTPYQYGSGSAALDRLINNKIKNIVDLDVSTLLFDFKKWEDSFAKHLPASYALRKVQTSFSSRFKTPYIEFKAPDGVEMCITGVVKPGARDENNNKIAEKHQNVISGRKVQYNYRDVSVKYLGVAHIAAYSHALDAYTFRNMLHSYFLKTQGNGFIIPVHDAAYVHPNDLDLVWDCYSDALKDVVKNGKSFLKGYLEALVANSDLTSKPKKEQELYINTWLNELHLGEIKPEDITGGLYIG